MIEFRRVSKVYHTGTHALKDVSFKILDGEFVFVIGRSGAGKSTLIKLLTCEEKPSDGSVLIDDFDISRIRRSLIPFLRRNIGMIFQDFRLIDTKTVYENVAFAMEIIGASRRSIQRRVPIVLSIVGLREKASARPGELSGGEQQRVAIARAMVNNPMLILADEPTGNLDPSNSESVMALLEEINRSGTTVIICTHDHELVDRMKKRVIEISDGSLVRDDCEGAYAACTPVKQPYMSNSTDITDEEIVDLNSQTSISIQDEGLNISSEEVVYETQEIQNISERPQDDELIEQNESEELTEEIRKSLYAQKDLKSGEKPADDNTKSTTKSEKKSSREERIERALRKYRQKGHDIILPSIQSEEADIEIPDKEDLMDLSNRENNEAIS